MTIATTLALHDLHGTADERINQLKQLADTDLPAEWLRQQLDATLVAWGDDETELDIQREFRFDY